MGKIVKKTRYMTFKLVKKKAKSNAYQVNNRRANDVLGIIEWYPYWRQYIFEPSWERQSCVFNHTCLSELAEFLKELNIKHKEKKNQGM